MYVVVYNALSTVRTEVVVIPINADASYSVELLVDPPNNWEQVTSSLIPNDNYANINSAAGGILYFEASELPPIGARVYHIMKNDVEQHSKDHSQSNHLRLQYESEVHIVIANDILSVTFDR